MRAQVRDEIVAALAHALVTAWRQRQDPTEQRDCVATEAERTQASQEKR